MRILIYTGKGGVGKTSIAAATACKIAKNKKVLAISTDLAHSLGDCFDQKLTYIPTKIYTNLYAMEIDPMIEAEIAWGNMRDYLKEIIQNRATSNIESDEVLLFPGLDELFSLLKILDIYEKKEYDTLVVDCAPTGETLSFLSYSERLSVLADKIIPMFKNFNRALGSLIEKKTSVKKPKDIVFEEFEKLVKRLDILQDILHNRDITSMRIVLTPERIVLNEAIRSYTAMQLYDFGVDAIYINKIYPKEALKDYFQNFENMQDESIKIATQNFFEQKLFKIKLQNIEIRGIKILQKMADIIYDDVDPNDIFCKIQSFFMFEEHGTRIFTVNLPFANNDDIKVLKEEQDIIISFRNETRRFHLPDNVSRRKMTGYSYSNGQLRISMDY